VLLVAGYWLLVTGCWLLVAGCYLFRRMLLSNSKEPWWTENWKL